MKNLFFILAFLTSMNICYGSPFSQNLLEENESGEQFANEMLTNFSLSVDRCSHDRIYLNANMINVSSQGFFLKNGDTELYLPIVCSDRSGLYIPLENSPQTVSLVYCIGCGWPRFSGDSCKNPKCDLYGK